MEEEIEGLYEAVKRDLRAGVAVDFQALSASTRYSLVKRAVRMNHECSVTSLLDGGCPVNVRETDHDSPLHIAVGSHIKYDYASMVKSLLEIGADVNSRNENGETPLLIAVERRKSKSVELLLKYGADVNVDLFNAIREGNLHNVTALIDSPEESASSGLLGGYSPLRLAVELKQDDIVKLLLDRGYPVNASVINHKSALHLAVRDGNCEMVELLLRNGADVNAVDAYGDTALHFAAMVGCREIASSLIAKGADVNAKSVYGQTALHEAVALGHIEVVEFLLANGALVDCVDVHGKSPLHHLVRSGKLKKEMATLLLKWGADLNCKTEIIGAEENCDCEDEIGRTALHIATEEGKAEFVEFLLENGAKVNCQDERGRSPLHLVYDHKIIEILMEFGASVDCREKAGRTPLHFNSGFCSSIEVATLLEYGADINIKCDCGLTPLGANRDSYDDFCCDRDHDSINRTREVLLRHQAKMETVGLHVEKSKFSASDKEMLEYFRNSCQEEVVFLKSTLISGTSVSYYDLLRRDVRFLARYMNNENMVQAAESEEYRSKFTEYASKIKSRFRRGKARNQLLKSAIQVFNQLIDLPDYCTEKIMDYLRDDDLLVLIDV